MVHGKQQQHRTGQNVLKGVNTTFDMVEQAKRGTISAAPRPNTRL